MAFPRLTFGLHMLFFEAGGRTSRNPGNWRFRDWWREHEALKLNLPLVTALVVLVVAINGDTMPATLYPGDPYWMMQEARSILLEGKLSVDDSPGTQEGQYFVRNPNNHRCYSKYGTMNGLLFTPPLFLAWKRDGQLNQIRTETVLLFTNLYFVFLTAVLAIYLYILVGMYVNDPWVKLFYVLGSFYTTFLWNYLRAQSSELFQVLLFTAFVVHFVRTQRRRPEPGKVWSSGLTAESVLSWVFLGALCLTKISNLVLVPIALLAMILRPSGVKSRKGDAFPGRTGLLIGSMASLTIVLLIGWLNWTKFGSVWFTGYHQWKPAEHLPSGFHGILGFLFDRQWSIFLNYPPLFLAVFGLTLFSRRFPGDALLYGGLFAASLLLVGSLPTWKGEWCYGPRYLLFLLPVVSLPFALVVEEVCHSSMSLRQALLIANCLLALGGSLYLQVQVNRLPFLAYYKVLPAAVLGQHRSLNLADSELSFFARQPVQWICYELVSSRDNAERLECFRDFCRRYPEVDRQRYLGALTFVPLLDNYYFQ